MQAKRVAADDGTPVYTVTVVPHKTAVTHGAATLGLDAGLYRLLRGYVHNVRSRRGADHLETSRGPLWVTLRGNKVSAKRISHCIQKAWKLAGGDRRAVTTTLLRKTAVSKGFEHEPRNMPELGHHMTHTPAVQQRYYMVTKKRRNAANMTVAIKEAARATSRGSEPTTSTDGPRQRRGDAIRRIAEEIKKTTKNTGAGSGK